MRGKKIDSEFLCNFIIECTTKNITSTDAILNQARQQISEIDLKIKEVEELKHLRSKLLDIVVSFDKTIKNKTNEAKIIKCFDIKNQNICRFICKSIKDEGLDILELKKSKYDWQEILFNLKLLFINDVLYKSENLIYKNNSFEDYMRIVLKEDI